MIYSSLLILLFPAVLAAVPDPPPPELEAMVQHRIGFQTAHIEWTWNDQSSERGPLRYSSRYAGDAQLVIEHGDWSGCVIPSSCKEGIARGYSEFRHLYTEQREQWNYREDALTGHIYTESVVNIQRQPDIRTLGLLALYTPGESHEELAADNWLEHHLDKDNTYAVEPSPGGFVEVQASHRNGSTRWLLDPRRGWQPIEVEMRLVRSDGSLHKVYTSRTTYKEVEGRWFPERIEFVNSRNPDQPLIIEVEHASFDDPAHPQTLTPAEALGIVSGVNLVKFLSEDRTVRDDGAFNGTEFVSGKDYAAQIMDGRLDLEPFHALIRRHEDPNDVPGSKPRFGVMLDQTPVELSRKPGLWEDYTRRFIQRFRLEGEQIDRAWTHLKECQKPAYAYLDEQKSVIREAETERAKVAAELAKVEAELAKSDTDRATPGANPSPSTGAKEKSTSGAKEKSSSAEKEKSSAGAGTKDKSSASDSPQERFAAQAPDPASADAADDARVKQRAAFQEQLGKLDERLKKLYEPIEKIFEEKLKPGLAKLPTQAQIDAARAREAETSRTAAQPSGTAAEP